MTITRFSPIHDVAVLQNRLNSIFQDFARPSTGDSESLTSSSFSPAVDVYEDAQRLSLRVEVPGIKPEDIDLRVENHTLTLRGERRLASEDVEDNFRRIERRYGSFMRTFSLPQTIDTESVSARYEHGVLFVEFARKPEAKPKQVKIELGAGSGSASDTASSSATSSAKTVDAASH